MIPVCKPIIAVLALWSFVGMWNSYFDAMIYLNDANLQPLQLVLRSILVQNTPQPGMIADIQSTAEMAKVAEQLKYATIVVSSLPLLVMYPFFQKYFDKGNYGWICKRLKERNDTDMKKNRVKGLLALGLSLTMMISMAGCGKQHSLMLRSIRTHQYLMYSFH